MNSTLLAEIKTTEQDFEWYPTTNEIIDKFFEHVNNYQIDRLLDVGAGDGKVLNRFRELVDDRYHTNLFAIEKSQPLLSGLPIDISILGTDFWEQSLLDKDIDCIFSNPPYKQFVDWTTKIIREANANFLYLVIPERWETQQKILEAIKIRKAEYKIIGKFDFLNSEDRQARAKVHLVFVKLGQGKQFYHRHSIDNFVDPFNMWINEFFELDKIDKRTDIPDSKKDEKDRKNKINSLVSGNNLIEVLSELYREELDRLIANYQSVCSLDEKIFKELGISTKSITDSVKSKVHGLKNVYWQELFANYAPLTSRLTASSREDFIKSIRSKTNIDFTASNAYAITVWSIKNADKYLDKQLIETFNSLINASCVINYKSNQKVFSKNERRYYFLNEEHTHFKLDYRIVATKTGSLSSSGNYYYLSRGGLSESAANFIDDLIVIAKNLGFDCTDEVRNHSFEAGKKEEFLCKNKKGDTVSLMEVRIYMNGNFHIKFNQSFMLALNVEIGRLKGWIHNAQQAAQEMSEKPEEVEQYFNQSYSLLTDNSIRFLCDIK